MAAKYRAINRRIHKAEARALKASRMNLGFHEFNGIIARTEFYKRQWESRYQRFERQELLRLNEYAGAIGGFDWQE